MAKFVTFGGVVLNEEHVVSVQREPDGQVSVDTLSAAPGGARRYFPSGKRAEEVWEHFAARGAGAPTGGEGPTDAGPGTNGQA